MRVFSRFSIAIAAVLLLNSFALADEWTKKYPLTGRPELRLSTEDAGLRVQPWDKSEIEIRVSTTNWRIGDQGLRITESQNGNRVEFAIRSHSHFNFQFGGEHSRSASVEVMMPKQARLVVESEDGRVSIRDIAGELQVHTKDGAQELENVDGQLDSRASDGHVTVRGRFDSLSVSSSDGRQRVYVLPGSKMTSQWNIRASDGSIDLNLPRDFAADIELHTSDGNINLDVPVAISGSLGKKDIRGKINGGGQLISVHTSDGSIHIAPI